MSKISAYPELTATASDDLFVVVDTSAGTTKKIQASNRLQPLAKISDAVGPFDSVGLYDPAETTPDDGYWIAYTWDDGGGTFRQIWGAGDPATTGNIEMQILPGLRRFSMTEASPGVDGYIEGTIQDGSLVSFEVQAAGGQTAPMVEFYNATAECIFEVLPSGAVNIADPFGDDNVMLRAVTNGVGEIALATGAAEHLVLHVDATTAYIDIVEGVTPAAPVADTARLYTKDVGGKTGLYVLFPSGAEQQIKVEA